MITLSVNVQWDDDAGVWIATSDDIPGLCIQADSFDELIDIANQFAPELLELNKVTVDKPFSLRFVTERTTVVQAI
jgi:predicted RNase H-like HicB family nuclease